MLRCAAGAMQTPTLQVVKCSSKVLPCGGGARQGEPKFVIDMPHVGKVGRGGGWGRGVGAGGGGRGAGVNGVPSPP